jgi:undecaprenyl-diphosphatase
MKEALRCFYAGLGLLLLFVVLGVFVQAGHSAVWDQRLLDAVVELRNASRTVWARDLTALGSWLATTLFVVACVVSALFWRRNWLAARIVVVCTSIGVLSELMKFLFPRARPAENYHLVDVASTSFPSGHALGAAGIYVVMGLILDRIRPDAGPRFPVAAFLGFLLAACIGLSRIYLGVHFPSDVLGGLLAGTDLALMMAPWLSHSVRV